MRLVELGRFREGAINGERLVGSVYQMRHDFVVHQGVCTLLQIAPHEKLGKGEQANVRALDDIPAVEVADGPAQGIENTRDVDALGLLGQRIQTGTRGSALRPPIMSPWKGSSMLARTTV